MDAKSHVCSPDFFYRLSTFVVKLLLSFLNLIGILLPLSLTCL
jgi:hypothetical protein